MTDKTKPEELKDDDLDAAQGGSIAYGEEGSGLKRKRDSIEPDKIRGVIVSEEVTEI
jgi:hypothetical protein